jgi:hypothetical protein
MSNLEDRLLAFWKADAAVWRKQTAKMYLLQDHEPDKIDLTKQRAETARRIRIKERKFAAGIGRTRKIRGTMRVRESRDTLCAPTFKCVVCGSPFAAAERVRKQPLYCSRACNMAAFRIRQAMNG